jgi:hypothetical protein
LSLASAINVFTSSNVITGDVATIVGATGTTGGFGTLLVVAVVVAGVDGVGLRDVAGVDVLIVNDAGELNIDDDVAGVDGVGADDVNANGAGVERMDGNGESETLPLPLPANENGTGDDSVNG